MAGTMAQIIVVLLLLGAVCQSMGTIEEVDRNILDLNLPYGRGLDNELELARLLLLSPRLCHVKRNSELINSLLGLPKTMNNAGK